MTLSKALVPLNLIATRVAMVLGGTALLAAASQISVTMFPVPMTLQTLAVLTVAAWLAEAFAGLPVLANGGSTASFFSLTAGFLFGFLAMVAVAGIAADRGVKSFVGLSVAGLIAGAVLYVLGLAWPALVLGKSVPELLSGWMMPFLAGDTVKAIISALIVSGGWSVLARCHA